MADDCDSFRFAQLVVSLGYTHSSKGVWGKEGVRFIYLQNEVPTREIQPTQCLAAALATRQQAPRDHNKKRDAAKPGEAS